MKKFLLFSVSLITFCLAIGQNKFERYIAEKNYALVGSHEDYGYNHDVIISDSVSILVPYLADGENPRALRDSILTATLLPPDSRLGGNDVAYAMAQWKKIPAEIDGFRTRRVTKPKELDMNVWTSIATADTIASIPGMLTYKIFYYQYAGGAHGMSGYTYYNYYKPAGKIITLDQIFTPEGMRRLPALLQKVMIGTDPDLQDMVNISELPYGGDYFITPDKKMTFVYGEYEIGPYALGCPEITLKYSQIAPYLTQQGKQILGAAR